MKKIALLLLLIVIMVGCKNSSVEPPNSLIIEGKWEENYEYYNIMDGDVFPEKVNARYSAKTEIEINSNKISIKILPCISEFGIDSLGNPQVMPRSDTLYTGSYTLSKDTIEVKVKGFNNQKDFKYKQEEYFTLKYIYSAKGDTLKIQRVLSGSKYEMPSGDFMWNGSSSKLSGQFIKKK